MTPTTATVVKTLYMVDIRIALLLFIIGFILGLGTFIGLGLWLNKKKESAAKFDNKLDRKE